MNRGCSRIRDQQGDVGGDAENREIAERFDGATSSRIARFGRGDELGDERVVVDRDLVALRHPGVDADAGHDRLAVEEQRAGLRQSPPDRGSSA